MTRRLRAFTLLEVMVAIAILAFALMSVSDIVSGALRSQVLARDLDVATLLARGKMAELVEKYERIGFGVGGDSDDGTFEDEGHPEFRWRMSLVEPDSNLDGKGIAGILLGGGDLKDLFSGKADANGLQTVNAGAATMGALVEQQLNLFAASVKQGVRELRLTVSWKEGAREESFTVATQLVVMQAAGGTR